ncbi:hypothetical protein ABK040_001203 [Willaertia magna]
MSTNHQHYANLLDNISLWTIFEYLPLSSYLSILLTCKEWNEILINSKIFKENKNLILTLQQEIDNNDFDEMANITKKYKNNFTAILYLLKKKAFSKKVIYLNCDTSLKNNKLIILNSIFDKNGVDILNNITNKTLQQDTDILQKAYFNCFEYSKEHIIKSYCKDSDFTNFDFCNYILNNFINGTTSDIILFKLIKNETVILNYFKNHKLTAFILQNLDPELFKNVNLINDLIINNKNNKKGGISNQQLKLFAGSNVTIFDNFNNVKLIEFITKRPILIFSLYNKFNFDELIEICCKNPFVLKYLMDYPYYLNFDKNNFVKLVLEKNVKAFKVLSKEYRSIKLNKETVTNIIVKDFEMIKYVCDLTLQLFEELYNKNEQIKIFKNKLLFKKE